MFEKFLDGGQGLPRVQMKSWVTTPRTRWQWLEAVHHDHAVSDKGMICADWMAMRFDLKLDYAWPSYQHLAGMMNVSRPTAVRAVTELVKRGWIERHPVPGDTSPFYLTLPKELQPFGTDAATMGLYLKNLTESNGGSH